MALAIEQKKPAPVLARGGRRAAVQPGLFGTRPRNGLRLVLAVLLALMSLGPLLYMLSLSFQNNNDILGNTVLIPNHPTTSNYVQAWTENSFGHYFFNSLGVAFATVVITVVSGFAGRVRLRALQVPIERADLLYVPRQPRDTEHAAPDPAVPAHGPAPPARLARRAGAAVRELQPAFHDLFPAWLFRRHPTRVRGSVPAGRSEHVAGDQPPDHPTVVASGRVGVHVHLQRRLRRVPGRTYDAR